MSAADTIFALSSGAPPCAIAIIRISGASAFAAVGALAGHIPNMRRPSLAKLYDPVGRTLLDEALLLLFPGPASATGEDLAELHLHGGRAVVRSVERALAAMASLRPAQAGEFTRRAFANGRIDLNQAEGLSDLLAAETEYQRRAAAQMAGGAFSRAIEDWRRELLRLSALTEAELDMSDEDDVAEQDNQDISIDCGILADRIESILAQPPAEKLRDGLRVVIGGPPNSGKSTLLNALAGRDAAIVTAIAGTTRDVIELPLAIEGIAMILTDTAGIRDGSEDPVETIGIARAQDALAAADIILWLGPEGAGPAHPALIEVETKSDLADRRKSCNAIWLSGKTGAGLPALITEMTRHARAMLPPADGYAANNRQRGWLAEAAAALRLASVADDWLIVGEQLRLARRALDGLTGRASTEDMLDALFGTFCVGK